MRTRRKEITLMIVAGVILFVVGITFSSYYDDSRNVIQSLYIYMKDFPMALVRVSFTKNTAKILSVCAVLYLFGSIYYMSSWDNRRPGEEYGSSRFANPRDLLKEMADRELSKNRILSRDMLVSYDSIQTKINNHVLVIGGSGTGKTRFVVKPNAMQLYGNSIIIDPDAGALKSLGGLYELFGYKVKVINIVDMLNSDGYNPFNYIETEEDIIKLIDNIMKNTQPADATKGDPFWTDATANFLKALMFYVFDKATPAEKNFNTVMTMLKYARLKYDSKGYRIPNALDKLFRELEIEDPEHRSLTPYYDIMEGADDTVRSILQSVKTRLKYFDINNIKHILEKDSIELEKIDEEKTVVFCVIPEDDDTFNFIIGMFYTQLFQVLFRKAKKSINGRLNIPINIHMDEFPNVAIPEGFLRILATARKYGINLWIYIQSFSQLPKMFKQEAWEQIPDNCDAHIYLGGNSNKAFKTISERLGSETINKRSFSESKTGGSKNEDIIGRKLMDASEVAKLPNDKCLVFLRGHDPVKDDKFTIKKHPNYKYIYDGTGKPYEHKVVRLRKIENLEIDLDDFEVI